MERTRLSEFVTADLGTCAARAIACFSRQTLWRIPTADRKIYLTFDDGPSERTAELLDLLGRFGASATLFLLGRQCRKHKATMQRVVESSNVIGNHSMTHPDGWRVSRTSLWRDLFRATSVLEEWSGRSLRLMRPPYGHFTPGMFAWCRRAAQQPVMWDVVAGDYLSGATAARIAGRVIRNVRPGSIVVLHDNDRFNANTIPAVEQILKALSEEGWQFHTLPQQESSTSLSES